MGLKGRAFWEYIRDDRGVTVDPVPDFVSEKIKAHMSGTRVAPPPVQIRGVKKPCDVCKGQGFTASGSFPYDCRKCVHPTCNGAGYYIAEK